MREIDGFLLTNTEAEACITLIKKMREEEAHKKAVQKCKNAISFEIAASISEIGIDETKRIVRELNKELR